MDYCEVEGGAWLVEISHEGQQEMGIQGLYFTLVLSCCLSIVLPVCYNVNFAGLTSPPIQVETSQTKIKASLSFHMLFLFITTKISFTTHGKEFQRLK